MTDQTNFITGGHNLPPEGDLPPKVLEFFPNIGAYMVARDEYFSAKRQRREQAREVRIAGDAQQFFAEAPSAAH